MFYLRHLVTILITLEAMSDKAAKLKWNEYLISDWNHQKWEFGPWERPRTQAKPHIPETLPNPWPSPTYKTPQAIMPGIAYSSSVPITSGAWFCEWNRRVEERLVFGGFGREFRKRWWAAWGADSGSRSVD